jgi:hypothetical protein
MLTVKARFHLVVVRCVAARVSYSFNKGCSIEDGRGQQQQQNQQYSRNRTRRNHLPQTLGSRPRSRDRDSNRSPS